VNSTATARKQERAVVGLIDQVGCDSTLHKTTSAPATTATQATAVVQMPWKPESSLYDASEFPPDFPVAEGDPGVVPATTTPVNGTEVAPSGTLPAPCPAATREE
jgi:hypothetical protein